jgi:hypothetical protein
MTQIPSEYNRLRNLTQYRNMTDDEFLTAMDQRTKGIDINKTFEERIKSSWEKFEHDYDLSDMKENDKVTLRALIVAMIFEQDFSLELYNAMSIEGIEDSATMKIKRLSEILNKLRGDITDLQNALKITRKVRKDDEGNLLDAVENAKEKAKAFYKQTMQIIQCPKCNKWLGTVWFLDWESKKNKIELVCTCDTGEKYENGMKVLCGEKIVLTAPEIIDQKRRKKLPVPDSIR